MPVGDSRTYSLVLTGAKQPDEGSACSVFNTESPIQLVGKRPSVAATAMFS